MPKLYLIGTGPGDYNELTGNAVDCLNDSDIIMGYSKYIELISNIIKGKEVESGSVTDEIERANTAISHVLSGKNVSIVSSGDSAIYGMAGIVFEIIAKHEYDIDVKIIPGITAISSAGSLLGVPFMNDFCSISLSDKLTPEDIILKRINAAGSGDFVVALYNPVSIKRTELIKKAREIMLKYREGNTPVGIVRNAYRESESAIISTLDDFLNYNIDMFTLVVIGNSSTYTYQKYMITPRNYDNKYNI
ncbi:precorrin-3B C(17)-methyltransferase [Ferroplasma sp.]|uniref:precorrin-3B C(17)-methyltransferase n=1 Tax=Ferroplasma sp. TaxID=2591003 RepID=UPI00307E0664